MWNCKRLEDDKEKLVNIAVGSAVSFGHVPNTQAAKAEMGKWDAANYRASVQAKVVFSQVKRRRPREWKKAIASHVFEKKRVSKVYKQFKQPS